MKTTLLFVSCGIFLGAFSTIHLHGDQLQMQNGDRYVGKILSVTGEGVVLQSEVLGKVKLPRNKVAHLAFGTNAITPPSTGDAATISVPTNIPNVAALAASAKVDTNLSATASNLAANPDLVRQVREQMLAGSPEASRKFNELVNGFANGKINMNDLRREAKSSADQLRKLQHELGPEVGDALDAYLEILDGFLRESANETTTVSPNTPVR